MAKNTNNRESIKTFDDVLAKLGNTDSDVQDFNKLKAIFDGSHHLVAYQKCVLISKALNDGWTPDWTDRNFKYWPWFNMGSASGGFSYYVFDYWDSTSSVGSRLCFKSSELAKYAGTQFEDIYKDFLTLNS